MNKLLISKIVNCTFIFAVMTSCPSTASCAKIDALAQRDAVSEVDTDLAKLEAPRQAGDLDSLEKLIDSDLKKWRVLDQDLFLAYMYGACSEISSYAYNDRPKQAKLLTHYSLEFLGSGHLSLEDQVRFVEFLGYDAPDLDEVTWQHVRFRKATLWLDTWRHLSESRDPNFDPSDVPLINIAPPPESGLPSGVSSEDVKDPKLRAEYERRLASNRAKAVHFKEQ
jgi:hypothetical protein